jgi:hypothetical protein
MNATVINPLDFYMLAAPAHAWDKTALHQHGQSFGHEGVGAGHDAPPSRNARLRQVLTSQTTPPELTEERHLRPPKTSASNTWRDACRATLDPIFGASNELKPLTFFRGFAGAPVS